ncbi:MAG: BofC C-terminal domain-containing protein [Patescibacteria group bacterium]
MPARLRLGLILAGAVLILAGAGAFLWPAAVRTFRGARRRAPEPVSLVRHLACGHKTARGKIDPALVRSLAKRPVGAHYGDYVILARRGKMLSVAREIQGLCPSCRRLRFLGIADGLVAVYAGTPRHPGDVLEVTRIAAAALPGPELADLQRGIPYRGDGERLQLLEGLAALVNE